MTKQLQEYPDLLSFLLGPLRKRPGMFLGEAKISRLSNFITGYMICLHTTGKEDNYFTNPGFMTWFYDTYKKKQTSFLMDPFLEEAHGNETEALQIYFKYLEKYARAILVN